MGISLTTAIEIYRSCRGRGLTGTAVILGKQDLDFGLDGLLIGLMEAGELARAENSVIVPPEQMAVFTTFRDDGLLFSPRSDPSAPSGNRVLNDSFFFSFVGFSSVRSVDYDGLDGADVLHDLNQLGLATKLPPCDFVYDGGTMEHVFHTPNFLRNVFDVLAPGGFVLHHSPSNNFMDHGFYQFSPTMFWDFYRANAYDDIKIRISARVGGVDFWHEYWPSTMLTPAPLKTGDGPALTECWARKTEASTGDAIPQQGAYVRLWDETKRDE